MRLIVICCLLLAASWTTASAQEPNVKGASQTIESFGLQLPLDTPQLSYFARIPAGMKVDMTWIAEDCGDVCPANTPIATLELTGDGSVAHCQLGRPTKGWPIGIYRIEVRHEGRLLASNRFMMGDVMVKHQRTGQSEPSK